MKFRLGLLLTLITAFLLWTFDLASLPNGLYWDEMDVGYQAFSLIKTGRDYFGNVLPLFPHSFADFRTPVIIYSAIPFILIGGLTETMVRLPTVIWALLGLLSFYLLSRRLLPSFTGFFSLSSGIFLILTPWYFTYARMGFEISSLFTLFCLALLLFLKSLTKPIWLPFSVFFFVLSAFAYSPGKFLTPVMLVLLVIIYFPILRQLSRRLIIISLIFLLPLIFLFSGSGNSRFHDIAVFTDPQTKNEVNRLRQIYGSTLVDQVKPGMTPGLLNRFLLNQPGQWLKAIENNYLSAFSTEFLFLKGDPQIRHSPGVGTIGMLSPITFPLIIIGFFVLLTRLADPRSKILLLWLILAPVSSAVTRDGAMHASRLILLLPPLLLLTVSGLNYLVRKSRFATLLVFGFFFLSSLNFISYYFTFYRYESAYPFQWGFSRVVSQALSASPAYDRVFIDTENDSALMAYLFSTRYSPSLLQSRQPLSPADYPNQLTGFEFGNLTILTPGVRNWTDLRSNGQRWLVYLSAHQPLAKTIHPRLEQINYPDSSSAFFVFTIPR